MAEGAEVLRKGRGPSIVLWGLCRRVTKLRCPEEGGPHVEKIIRESQNMGTWVLR